MNDDSETWLLEQSAISQEKFVRKYAKDGQLPHFWMVNDRSGGYEQQMRAWLNGLRVDFYYYYDGISNQFLYVFEDPAMATMAKLMWCRL